MAFISEWRQVVRKAWSIRLAILAGFLSGIESVLPLFDTDIPRSLFALLSLVVSVAAVVARIVAQPRMAGDGQ